MPAAQSETSRSPNANPAQRPLARPASKQHLATLGFRAPNIAIVGYCMGGTVSFFAATLSTVGAAASFYGGGLEKGRFGIPSLIELAPDPRHADVFAGAEKRIGQPAMLRGVMNPAKDFKIAVPLRIEEVK